MADIPALTVAKCLYPGK